VTAETSAAPTGVPQLVLSGRGTSPTALIRAIWQSRELCWTIARKDFFVRYRRAAFGVLWAVALPAVQALVLSIVLKRVARIDVPHYSVFIFSGVVGWSYFSMTVGAGATSIVDSSSLSSKIYFPRAVLPISVCISGMFTLAVSVAVLLVVQVIAGVGFGLHVLYFIPAFVLVGLLATAFTLTLSAAQVYLRDIKYAVQAAMLVWFYVTPIFYPLSLLDGTLKALVIANPMTGVVELFHAASVGYSDHLAAAVGVTAGWTVALMAVGLWLHCRYDRLVADLL
jgi:ABC-type polysaccharide/polyol phosphate export permease